MAEVLVEDGDGEAPEDVAEELRTLLAGGEEPGGGSEADPRHDDFMGADLDGEPEGDSHAEGDDGQDFCDETVGCAHEDAEGEVNDK